MNILSQIYRSSLGLLTDFYQLTMAYGYFKKGMQDREAVFNLFFRSNPFRGGYTVHAGLKLAIDYISSFSFSEDDIAYFAGLENGAGEAYLSLTP